MRKINAIATVLAVACAVRSCVKRPEDAQKASDKIGNIDAYDIARDSRQNLHARIEATSRLTQTQKKQLQNELLKEVPGDYDVKTHDAIWLLAEVGDMAAAEKLEQFKQDRRYDIPGKINYAASAAIEEIHKRESKTNH